MGQFAFKGEGKYADFTKGYELYCRRNKSGFPVDARMYSRVVRAYCKHLADRLLEEGMVDFPNDNGTLITTIHSRKPQYRGNKFIGFGKMDWNSGIYDGSHEAFGVVFLPRRNKTNNLRCYGFVANRRLYYRLKGAYMNQTCDWKPMKFNDKMI